MISDKGDCLHVSGKCNYRCYRQGVSSQSSCEDYCTSQITCVGYDYKIEDKNCYLYPSEKSCPSGFSVYSESGPTAASMNDLTPALASGHVCYGKL